MKMIFEDSDSRLRQRAFKGSWTNTTGRRFGCLKRRSKVGEICPLFSEAIKVIPKREWDDYLKAKPSMWPDAQFVYDQNGVGCHDDQTEVLTESGWQFWSEYDQSSALGTINPVTHDVEYQQPTHLHTYDYNGNLYHIDNKKLNFALTPNHRMYVKNNNDYDICKAECLKNNNLFLTLDNENLSVNKKDIKISTYNGKVYCATVPNSLLVTRRNKKVLISGNSCAAESTVGNFTTTRVFNGLPLVEFNPWFVYNTTSGGRDGGSSIDENLEFMRKYGVAPASIWPRSKGWRAKPSAEAYAEALKYRVVEFYDITNAEELGSALLQGFCVTFGRSGHAIYSIELVSTSTHRYMNSWGDWGDKGTEVENLSRINWGYGAFAIRVVTDTDGPTFKTRLSEMPPINPKFEAYPTIEAA